MIRNYRDLTRWEMEQIDKEETIVLIPLGALEQHGSQAPLGTDDIIAEAMTKEIQKALEGEGEDDFPMLVFPVIPVGLSTEHKNFCGSITVKPDTYYHMLYDISISLAHHGFKKLAFLICHGGNAPIVQVLSRELRSELGISPFILTSGAFTHPDVTATISEGNIWDFHGGEMETSMVMAVDESLVKLELSEAEKESAKADMERMLDYIDTLNELDTEGIVPMSHVFPISNVFREDVVKNEDRHEEMLANAPEQKEQSYKVPKTIA